MVAELQKGDIWNAQHRIQPGEVIGKLWKAMSDSSHRAWNRTYAVGQWHDSAQSSWSNLYILSWETEKRKNMEEYMQLKKTQPVRAAEKETNTLTKNYKNIFQELKK